MKTFLEFIKESKKEFDLTDINKKSGGGIQNIKYDMDDLIIDKSPLSKELKKEYPRGKKITYKDSKNFNKKIISTTKDKIKIYSVDGTYIRDNIDIDFTMGGHAYIYPNYIPEDEVWIDGDMNDKDKYTTIIHELSERNEMKNKKLDYDEAHNNASKKEKKLRKDIK